jgi:hypothetical protein
MLLLIAVALVVTAIPLKKYLTYKTKHKYSRLQHKRLSLLEFY